MDDPFDLERFIEAQLPTYAAALAQIRGRAKRSHWMWYIFPQIAGLGSSPTARHFGLRSLDEAKAYLAHPVLGARYRECVRALQQNAGSDATAMFGTIDAMKLRSSLTLFAHACDDPLFRAALTRWCGGPDPATLRLLGGK